MDCLYNEKPAIIANSEWSKIGFYKFAFDFKFEYFFIL